MSLRLLALIAAGAGAVLYQFQARPTEWELEREQVLYAQGRRQREELRERLGTLERAKASPASPREDAVPLRQALMSCIEGSVIERIRIDLKPSRGLTSVQMSGSASFPESIRLLSQVLGPRVGLVPHRLHLAPARSGVSFNIDGEHR